jgi:hypothetical protein
MFFYFQVAVLGVLERIGICAAKDLTKSSFKAVTQVLASVTRHATILLTITTLWIGT